jgi:thiol-disulfide isomerase/thioredoxin
MTPLARNVLIAGVAVIAAVAGFVVANFSQQEQLRQPVVPPANAKLAVTQLLALTLPDPSTVAQPLSRWKDKLLVVNFWATWCLPCREEMPGFSRLHTKYAAKGVQFVGIAFDSADKVREFSDQTPVSYPLLIATASLMPLTAALGDAAGGLPFTVVVGRDGSLLQTRLGLWKEAALEAILADQVK